jgi:Mg2+ and Co2+ transporter CorA
MTRLKRRTEMDEIEIKITPEERDLILDLTFADEVLTDRLKIAEMRGKHLVARYSISDLDDLIGFIAAEANHAEDKKLQKKLDRLIDKLERMLEE